MADETKEIFDALLTGLPPNELAKANEVYAILSVDERGNEGVCGVNGAACVFVVPRVVDKMVARLRTFGSSPDCRKLRVVKFTGRELVEEIDLSQRNQ